MESTRVVETVRITPEGDVVAAYACPLPWGSYRGYFKVAEGEAQGYFDLAACVLKGSGSRSWDDARDALSDALVAGHDAAQQLRRRMN